MSNNRIISVPGKAYSFIVLTQGQVAIVDNTDLPLLSNYKWSASFMVRDRKYRAVASIICGKKKVQIYMHQLVMGTPSGFETDHINRYSLDNRKKNLRVCTHSQNMMNQRVRPTSISGYKGVYVVPRYPGKWRAIIQANKKYFHLGTFDNPEDAAIAYNQAAMKYHGEYALLNTIPDTNLLEIQSNA